MPNGKPGDHPLTDILVHHIIVFSPTVDHLIREIVSLGGRQDLEARWNLFSPPPLTVFEAELQTMRNHLRQQAQERGWEIDSGRNAD